MMTDFCTVCTCHEDCEIPEWIGDGLCDDVTNHPVCNFDGGDCCLGPDMITDFCTDCFCLEDPTIQLFPVVRTEELKSLPAKLRKIKDIKGHKYGSDRQTVTVGDVAGTGCEIPEWVGDGYCDDITNNVKCNFDGGDCCLGPDMMTDFCTVCTCHEDCEIPEWIGDGLCDDVTNHPVCNFDGGDCCLGPDMITDFCTDCFCLEDLGIVTGVTGVFPAVKLE